MDGVPQAAVVAFAAPFGVILSALGADKGDFTFTIHQERSVGLRFI